MAEFMYLGTSADIQDFAVPHPTELTYQGEDILDSARTVSGQVVGTHINRTQETLQLKWDFIKPADWYAMNRWIRENGKFFYCRFYSYIFGEWVTRRMYAGDPACTPVLVKDNNEAVLIQNATRNVIDMGA